jgi:hypothetical protein
MASLWQDLRHGLRVLRSMPGFTSVAALVLAAAAKLGVWTPVESIRG